MMYSYYCITCNQLVDEFRTVDERNVPGTCTHCGANTIRDIAREKRDSDVAILERDNPRWSKALGCQPEEIPEFKRQFPGSEYNNDGDLLIRNRKHKLQELKRRGYVEYD